MPAEVQTEQNKANARRAYEAISQGNLDAFYETVDPNIVDHSGLPGIPPGLEGVRQWFSTLRSAFPDLRINAEDIIAEGDKVVARYSVTGTHQGEFWGIGPTGKQVTFSGIDIVRVADGKLVEHWGEIDALGLMQQLGAIPAPGQ